jgi:hypothetical protein
MRTGRTISRYELLQFWLDGLIYVMNRLVTFSRIDPPIRDCHKSARGEQGVDRIVVGSGYIVNFAYERLGNIPGRHIAPPESRAILRAQGARNSWAGGGAFGPYCQPIHHAWRAGQVIRHHEVGQESTWRPRQRGPDSFMGWT